MRLLPCGDAGLLVELADLDEVLALYAELVDDVPEGVVDLVPAARTLLLRLDPARTDTDRVARAVREVEPKPGQRPDAGRLEVPVTYDGADLAEVGRLTGLGERGVVAAHTAQAWTVAFCGFAPGFGYLVGGDDRLHRAAARRPAHQGAGRAGRRWPASSPASTRGSRPAAGSCIGHTTLQPWDLDRDPPALLVPGVRVRFVRGRSMAPPAACLEVLATGPAHHRPGPGPAGAGRPGRRPLRCRRRPGAAAGQPAGRQPRGRGGARGHLRRAGGRRARVHDRDAHRRPVPGDGRRPRRSGPYARRRGCPTGRRLRLGPPRAGLRSYLAVRGGIDVAAACSGSRSTDTLAGLGPGAARARGPAAGRRPRPGRIRASTSHRCRLPEEGDVALRVVDGPRADWFTRAAHAALVADAYEVTADSNRVGMRLSGPVLERLAGPASCPARAWSAAPCRCRRPASRPCSSPTTPSPAATP